MSAIESFNYLLLAVKFVNSFARRQHLFDMAAKPIDVDSNIVSYRVPVLISRKMQSSNLFAVTIISRKFHRNPLSVLAKRKEIIFARDGRRDGHKPRRTRTSVATSAAEAERDALVWPSRCVLLAINCLCHVLH